MLKLFKKSLWLLNNQVFILFLAILFGLISATPAKIVKPGIIPIIITIMIFSVTGISVKDFSPFKKVIKPVLAGIICNYLIFGSLILLISRFFVFEDNNLLWLGFIVVSMAPPGVAVVPFSYLLRGNVLLASIGTFGAFAAAIVIAPLVVFLLTGEQALNPNKLFIVLFQLIVLPFLISRILLKSKKFVAMLKYRGIIINWGMFFVIFLAIGLNRNSFFAHPEFIALTSFIAIVSIFGSSLLFEKILKKSSISREDQISLMLMGSIKNGAFATVTALTLFGPLASISAGVFSAFTAVYLIYLKIRFTD